MTGPLYPNQPLVEVATEVRFKGDLAVEAVRPKYHNMVKERYPRLMVPGAQEGIAPAVQPYRFECEDQAAGIQLAINSFSYYARKYPGHDSFLTAVENELRIFMDLIDSIEVTRIGWRYINAIPFARSGGLIPLDKYFNETSIFGTGLKTGLNNLSYRVQLPIKDKQISVKLESAESTQDPGVERILLDIDTFANYEPSANIDLRTIMTEINSTHDLAYEIFENIITDNYRLFLKGSDDNKGDDNG